MTTPQRTVPTRRISFEESLQDLPKHYAADGDLIQSHIAAGLSAVFPDGEDFFVRSVRHYRDQITDPELKRQVGGFIGQEAMHGRQHRLFNDRLDELGYPVKRIERSAPTNLAGAKEDIVTPDKANAVFVAGLAFPLKETDPAKRLKASEQAITGYRDLLDKLPKGEQYDRARRHTHGHHAFGHILRDDGARAGRGPRADRDRRAEERVRPDEGVVADHRAVLLHTVVVQRDRPRRDVPND